jgi:hypothetical protein
VQAQSVFVVRRTYLESEFGLCAHRESIRSGCEATIVEVDGAALTRAMLLDSIKVAINAKVCFVKSCS